MFLKLKIQKPTSEIWFWLLLGTALTFQARVYSGVVLAAGRLPIAANSHAPSLFLVHKIIVPSPNNMLKKAAIRSRGCLLTKESTLFSSSLKDTERHFIVYNYESAAKVEDFKLRDGVTYTSECKYLH